MRYICGTRAKKLQQEELRMTLKTLPGNHAVSFYSLITVVSHRFILFLFKSIKFSCKVVTKRRHLYNVFPCTNRYSVALHPIFIYEGHWNSISIIQLSIPNYPIRVYKVNRYVISPLFNWKVLFKLNSRQLASLVLGNSLFFYQVSSWQKDESGHCNHAVGWRGIIFK